MRAPRGICPVCGKEYALRRDGTMGAHGFRQDVWNGPRGYCDGEGKRPKEIVVSSPSSEPKRDPMEDPGDGSIELTTTLPEGAIPLSSVEVVTYLHPEGGNAHYVRWQGTSDIVTLLGMIEFAKLQLPHQAEDA